MQDYVIVVNASDEEMGREEKLQAHRLPVLHRAFSVFVLDERGAMLVQRRADGKYHSAGLWSNACCGHPRPGEQVIEAGERRLREEMGITCPLVPAGTVSYSIDVGDGLREDEFNHVLFGSFSGDARPDPSEVSSWRWMTPATVQEALRETPSPFTRWFPVVLERLRVWLEGHPTAVPAAARRAWESVA